MCFLTTGRGQFLNNVRSFGSALADQGGKPGLGVEEATAASYGLL